MKKLLLIPIIFMLSALVSAQEFRPTVVVNYQKLLTTTQQYESSADKHVFDAMKQAIEDFVGGRHWTRLEFSQQERIECTFNLILSQRSSVSDFVGQLSVQMKRPVYNSSYTTGLFNYMEQANFTFSFNESQSLEFDPNNFSDNLSTTLAYYCYIMLGIYLDSFSFGGGEPMFDMARVICLSAESSNYLGWRATEGNKSRYWFMENHTNSAYSGLHAVYYLYHRQGLDMMTKDQTQARSMIINALETLQSVNKQKTNLLSVQQFMDVKIQEINSIFTPAPEKEQQRVFALVKEISPINAVKLSFSNK